MVSQFGRLLGLKKWISHFFALRTSFRRKLLPMHIALILPLTILAGCAEPEKILMPPQEVTRFILDLSGSNKTLDQFERLKPAIYTQLKLESLGNPFSTPATGPVDLSLTFITGSASQARVIEITPSEFGFKLFSDLQKVYERTADQIPGDWPLIIAADRKALELGISKKRENCVLEISQTMSTNLGEDTSRDIAQLLCEKSSKIFNVIEELIPMQISRASGSDVFGALRELDTWVQKIKSSQPQSKIKVVIASDMVHNTNSQRDLFRNNGILKGKIDKLEICEIAAQQARLSALNFANVQVDIIGRGNAASITAEEGEALAIFWQCFAKNSEFVLNTSTDGTS